MQRSRPLVIAFIALIVLTALYALWPICRAALPLEVDVNEAWNASHADSLLAGRPLYPEPGGLVTNNYPPLSFYAVGVLSKLGGADPLYAGRLLSLVALLATALAVGALIRRFGGSRPAALLGVVWFGATLTRFFDRYVGMDDPSLPALALMSWALVWLFRRRAHGKAVEPAIALMVLAGFYKHNLVAIPITALAWLALHDRPAALRATLVGAALSVAGLALCVLAYGPAFLSDLMLPRAYTLRGLVMLRSLHAIAPALAIVILWWVYRRTGNAARFTKLFATVSCVVFVLEILGEGVDVNAQFELDVAVALALGLAFDDVGVIPAPRGWSVMLQRTTIVTVLVLRLVLAEQITPYLFAASPAFRAEVAERVALSDREVARVAALPRATVCSVALTCRWAGKPFLLDGFYVSEAVRTGKRSAAEIERLKATLGIHEVEVDPRTRKPVRTFLGGS